MLAADTDSNGEIDLEEFKIVMRQGHQQFGGITKAMLTLRVIMPGRSVSPLWWTVSLYYSAPTSDV